MSARRKLQYALALVLICIVSACHFHHASWRTAHMIAPSPRLQAVLSTLKPHCFGRFLIDLPEGTQIAWGNTLEFEVARGRAGELDAIVKEREEDRKKEERYPLTKHLNLYFETRNGSVPTMKHVISQRDFASEDFVSIDTYYALGDALIATHSRGLTDNIPIILDAVEDIARRLRLRAEDEIPTDPGQCIEHAFVADRPNAAHEEVRDFISVGFRLKDPADVHLSIDIAAATTELARPALDTRLDEADRSALAAGAFAYLGQLKLDTFRRAHREVPAWKDGFEFLRKARNDTTSQTYHDFWMIFRGEEDVLLRPCVDIRMQSGVADNESGSIRPTVTDEESIALWDALVGTIRVRPTLATKAEATPDAPIGTAVVTGSPCPRTGLWRCAEEGLPVQGGRERWFRAGDTLPSAVLLGEPTLLQRLKGEAPTHPSTTVWKLVGVDATPSR